ncbi:papain family cysteine protease, putative [Cryptosporidium muris RN66]|uniref:Papain family cysteine protease, putative n=1 Tax=Cryptosporidium muris (strain RN66) TaxID=441375 RepID=B6A947_CRYMR|nr:papain family cysteine protease, putative [Cryptosporidium muris RN66]EEA04738.1 papain family cysteine protease, putative [Cryptosporidium muris RN66]|eukprot:XP_002139087.1 papain family cysteine protease [Cryptosporidium muris RN66]
MWDLLEKSQQYFERDLEKCLKLIEDVYLARKLIPTAKFDISPSSILYSKSEIFPNMDIYTGDIKTIIGKNSTNNENIWNINLKNNEQNITRKLLVSNLPESFDLRSSKANPVNGGSCILIPDNQGRCADCYNYAALSSVEGSICRQLGIIVPQLSQQQPIDCWLAKKGKNKVCTGGQTFETFSYAMETKLCTQMSYPSITYKTGSPEACKFPSCQDCAGIDNYYWNFTGASLSYQDPWDTITNALYNYGPVTVSICSLMPGFSVYKGGFYNPPTCGSIWCGTRQVDHAITVVGYGKTQSNERYYILKNSWGVNWGNKGFMNISADMCSTLFNPGWITSIAPNNISNYCRDNAPNKSIIARDFII